MIFIGHAGAGGSGGSSGAVTRSWVGNGSTSVSLSADFDAAMIIIQGNAYTTIWSYGTTTAIVLSSTGEMGVVSVSSADGRSFTFTGPTMFIQSSGQSYYAVIFPLA